jgi:TonB family protein
MIVPLLALVFCSFALKLKPSFIPAVQLLQPQVSPQKALGTDTLSAKEFMDRWTKEMVTKKEISLTADEKSDWIAIRFEGGDQMVTHYSDFLKLAALEKRKPVIALPVRRPSPQVDEEASYPGGAQAWIRYLNATFQYPQEAQAQEIQGAVIIQFNVDQSGTVSNVEVLEGPVLGGLREEGVRIIRNSGTWIPASRKGKPVPSVKIQPIIFRLDPA